MSEVKIVATLTPRPEYIDTIRQAAQAMVPLTHQEAGCLQYDLHESKAIPDVRELANEGRVSFVFIERWKSEDDLKKHVAMPYHDDFLATLDGKLDGISVQRLTKLP
ncbi:MULTISPECIES: putative quinol monooxygenase [Enterobacteriaceae]|mgnify:CR=1 FL=1|uniref:Antibiotic biosynthesis monooxygenase n=1 Tax=Kluyvera genomosp. 2 TaxID=2774054 RepID=A0A2T2Y265_9ENTR|nr:MULTISPECIES: putative quinol monooxygenase [Enterobacteriaceae]HAT3918321.1 antibiotic biosynthesis monooxygenase [Kluyvera ascorbata]PSR46635.1 antibiotic biosynthesis monooxygenase [Kluyvera genomosp. 2]BBQ83652.1 antibiotic biosynthesis monooxygenase [Klebsiella sp. WP3-W18-ESBL-02]BBR20672.1 antibiotic biosynthesis monooxygenase [Klebsiella sp. WP3-S18-ESBL-05]BBR59141.1 antibiotic biosynthesis monooxygenase [Klebsiella sp. WP4-W18-ESBL-05]